MLQSATSSEPDDGLGDGDTAGDIRSFALGKASVSGFQRAERAGYGAGRVYTLSYTGFDLAGNSTGCSAIVFVPKSQSRK